MGKRIKICVLIMVACFICAGIFAVKATADDEIKEELHNPWYEDGDTIWDCIYFGNYYQDFMKDDNFTPPDEKSAIKWRVLEVDGTEATLISDQPLEEQYYNEKSTGATWDICTVRSWLNGYGAESNQDHIDYTQDNFIKQAFSTEEQKALLPVTLTDRGGVEQANKVQDKVYLLSVEEAQSEKYGFANDKARIAYNTHYLSYYTEEEYKKDNGYLYRPETRWWLRTMSDYNNTGAACVDEYGKISSSGYAMNRSSEKVRPVIHLDLSKTNAYTYAGKVCSNTQRDLRKEAAVTIADSIEKTYGDADFYLNPIIESDGEVSYSTSNDRVEVTKEGKVIIKKAGQCGVKISVKETKDYKSQEKWITINVKKATPHIILDASEYTVRESAEKAQIHAYVQEGEQDILYDCPFVDQMSAVTIAGGVIRGFHAGRYSVKAYVKESQNYLAAEKLFTVNVLKRITSISTDKEEYTFEMPKPFSYVTFEFEVVNGSAKVISSDDAILEAGNKVSRKRDEKTRPVYQTKLLLKQPGDVTLTISCEEDERRLPSIKNVLVHVTGRQTVVDDEDEETEEDFYTIISKKKKTAMYIGNNAAGEKHITIPDTMWINGERYKVVAIAQKSFANCNTLRSVTIGKNVTKIGKQAFYHCKNLKTIRIKTSKLKAKSIGKQAFAGIAKKPVVSVPKKQKSKYSKILKAKGMPKKAKIKGLS